MQNHFIYLFDFVIYFLYHFFAFRHFFAVCIHHSFLKFFCPRHFSSHCHSSATFGTKSERISEQERSLQWNVTRQLCNAARNNSAVKVGHSVSALVLFCCPCIRDEFSAFSTEMVRGFGGFFCYILRETAKISSFQKSPSKISSVKISRMGGFSELYIFSNVWESTFWKIVDYDQNQIKANFYNWILICTAILWITNFLIVA